MNQTRRRCGCCNGGEVKIESGFLGNGEDRLKVRALAFPVDHAGLDVHKSGLAEDVQELTLGEAEPDIGIEIAGLLELMLEEIEYDDSSSFAQNFVRRTDGSGGIGGVMQGLTEEGQINRAGADGWVFDVSEAKLEVLEPVGLGQVRPVGDHFGRVIDGYDGFGTLGKELGERSFARAEVGNVEWRHEAEERLAEAFPGSSGNVVTAEFPGEGIEVGLCRAGAFLEHELERRPVSFDLGDFAASGFQQRQEVNTGLLFAGLGFLQPIQAVLAGASVGNKPGGLQSRELGGDVGLRQAEYFLKFRDGEFFVSEQQQEPNAGGVRDEA